MELWNFLNDQCDGVVIDFEIEIALFRNRNRRYPFKINLRIFQLKELFAETREKNRSSAGRNLDRKGGSVV